MRQLNSGSNPAVPATAVKASRPHPLMMGAAVSLITFSLLGIGAITGVIPSARSDNRPAEAEQPAAPKGTGNTSGAGKQFAAAPACGNCGVVDAIRTVTVNGNASGVGAVAGGVTGAVVGHQIGNGRGRDAMTVLGGVGGAFAGHAIEKNINQRTVYRITVRMDDGSFRTVSQSHAPSVAVGGKVRVSNGSLVELS